MNEKQKLVAKEVLEAVKGGLSDDQLISKFQLSQNALQGVLGQLVDGGWLTQSELAARASLFGETIEVPGKKGAPTGAPTPQSGDHDKGYCSRCRREVTSAPGQQFCSFCGGTLAQPEQDKYSPWEDGRNLGWPQAFIQTINNCLFSPKAFFSGLPSYGGYQKPLMFGIILASIGMIFSQVWSVVFQMGPLGHYGGRVMAIALIVFAPVLAAMVLPLASLLLHACVLLVSEGSHKGFEATFRVCCYSTSAQVCNFIPVLGSVAYFIWYTYLLVLGLREVHDISTGKAAVAVFLPWMVILVLLVLFLFVALKAAL